MLIDKLCYVSKLRYINTDIKLFFSLLSLCFCVITRDIAISVIILVTCSAMTIRGGKIPAKKYFRLLRTPAAFLCISCLAIMAEVTQNSELSLSPLAAFNIAGIYIYINHENALLALTVAVTALASISCLFFLALSTPPADLLYALGRERRLKIRIPRLIIELMLLIYRFIFILLDTAHALHTAQLSRLGNRNLITGCKSTGALFATLFVRALQRSSKLYDSMESRCYDGTLNILTEQQNVNKKHLIAITAYTLGLISTYLLLHL